MTKRSFLTTRPPGSPARQRRVFFFVVTFFSDPASGRTSGNRGNIEQQVPRPSEEGHGARSGESDVVCGSVLVEIWPRNDDPGEA